MRRLLLVSTAVCMTISGAGFSDEKPKQLGNSPVGVWKKIEVPNRAGRTELTITTDKLTWIDSGNRVEADYSVTKDSILFAIITKIAVIQPTNGPPNEDDTFSFRFRADEGELNIRALKGLGVEQLGTPPR